jgi:putative transposase
MPWSEACRMDERARFVRDAFSDYFTMTELCARYGISRKTGYKWLKRYEGGGMPACADAPRAPRSHPNATPPEVVDQVLALRRKYPDAGPRTLLWYLEQRDPRGCWPRPSTIGQILKRYHLVRPRRRRRPRTSWSPARTPVDAPNRVWTADFKGQFRLGNGLLCYPLTVLDGHTRFLLSCRALKTTATGPARRGFEAAFEEFGVFSWHRAQIFVTEALRNETLGLEPVAEGLWSVFFGDVLLGRFDEENSQFLAGMGR